MPPIVPTDEERQVAQMLVDAFEVRGVLTQKRAVRLVRDNWTGNLHRNKNGNAALNPGVLAAFDALTPHAVWSRSRRLWRLRRGIDPADARAVR